MRHLLFALLIALLPLRGWVGDAMALNVVHPMPVGNSVVVEQAARHTGPAAHHATDAHSPTPAHAGTEAAASAQATGHAGCAGSSNDAGQHDTCSACDLCNGPALVWTQAARDNAQLPHSRVAQASASFASSEPEPGIKPPIS